MKQQPDFPEFPLEITPNRRSCIKLQYIVPAIGMTLHSLTHPL
jgi:hypothetical protein